MDEAEEEDHEEQVGCLPAQQLVEAVQVLEALVDHAQRDDRVDEIGVGRDPRQRGPQQRDAVAQGEGRDEANDVAKALGTSVGSVATTSAESLKASLNSKSVAR